ncbi:DUF4282 domain-containing protein [Granulicoccus sp. GXG6511]|uniref:DUF4282 domain-containing protein n=1 Tax=Granulicoccus sp. GXG6511 TaxID=3381351 RepID=UPI003D7CDA8A
MSYSNSGYSSNQPDPNQAWGNNPNQGWSGDDQNQAWGDTDQTHPTSQSSAGYPSSQSSAGYPSSQSSAGYPSSQPSGDYGDSQQIAANQHGAYGAPGGYPAQAGFQQQDAHSAPGAQPTQDAYGQQGYGQGYGQQGAYGQQGVHPAGANQWSTQRNEDSFIKAIFDFGFTRYATPSVVKILYILGIVVGGLGWFLSGLFWILIGGAASAFNPYGGGGGGGMTFMGVLAWIFGLIPLFFWIIGLRVTLEYALATVRINQDSKVIREKLEA